MKCYYRIADNPWRKGDFRADSGAAKFGASPIKDPARPDDFVWIANPEYHVYGKWMEVCGYRELVAVDGRMTYGIECVKVVFGKAGVPKGDNIV